MRGGAGGSSGMGGGAAAAAAAAVVVAAAAIPVSANSGTSKAQHSLTRTPSSLPLKRTTGASYTTDWTTVAAWGENMTRKIFGLHSGATKPETDKAKQLLVCNRELVCYGCGGHITSHKKTFFDHMKTASCQQAYEKQLQLNASAAQNNRRPTLLWAAEYIMLMAVDYQRREGDEGEEARAAKIP
jgi:hypothetical protein